MRIHYESHMSTSLALSSLIMFILLSQPITTLAKGYIQVGNTKIEENVSYWLALPGQPTSSQDQTSGIYALGDYPEYMNVFPGYRFISVGDDSGNVFLFNLTDHYLSNMLSIRIPEWRNNLDLEEVTLLPATKEIAVTLEAGDTEVRILSLLEDKFILDERIKLELPPGYKKKSNTGPEGLAFDPENNYLIVGWEGNQFSFPPLPPYLSIYKLFLGTDDVTTHKFIQHIKLPDYFLSCSGLFFCVELKTLLVCDRNASKIFAIRNFNVEKILKQKTKELCPENALPMPIQELVDPFGREFQYYSLEGITVDKEGTLYLVTDPWRSADFSTYKPISGEIDEYYRLFVPQLFEFKGFLDALRREFFKNQDC